MLTAIIDEMRNTAEPITLRSISHKLGLEESAVDGMLEILIRKGIVRNDARHLEEVYGSGKTPHCPSCPVTCCSMVNFPVTYSLCEQVEDTVRV